MTSVLKTVISASRRTDIPAFYMEWFMDGIGKGYFEVENPYSGKTHRVDAAVDSVHTIVFWSKNFSRFLSQDFGELLREKGYPLFFNFTLNSQDPLLEPNLPPLTDRLDQMDDLCRRFEARTVQWRFDPICFYRETGGPVKNNLGDFKTIADRAAACGIETCITSFVDLYAKVKRRAEASRRLSFVDPPAETKKRLLLEMEAALGQRGMSLFTCCEKEILNMLPAESTVSPSACIPNEYLIKLYGGRVSLARDRGQRMAAGCGCRISSDIGSYRLHPCPHNCIFCYANPAS